MSRTRKQLPAGEFYIAIEQKNRTGRVLRRSSNATFKIGASLIKPFQKSVRLIQQLATYDRQRRWREQHPSPPQYSLLLSCAVRTRTGTGVRYWQQGQVQVAYLFRGQRSAAQPDHKQWYNVSNPWSNLFLRTSEGRDSISFLGTCSNI